MPWGVARRADRRPRSPWPWRCFVAKLALLGVAVAVLETRVAKLRLFRVPELLSVSFVLALLAVTSSFLLR